METVKIDGGFAEVGAGSWLMGRGQPAAFFGRAVRRSTAQLKALKLEEADKSTARRKLDTCLQNLEELRRSVEALKNSLD